ncbi:phage protein Gp27 family protein [Sulfurihydrogenibium sp.]|uniref:phage protein Gp27 family protein n=1 Tax=Sulfurihydrogenibium sp. TaxID=2053621 RepID=UPI00262EC51B|nr:phage protein Gp27 family protein [Sulfurihydrogenibium sp.]
MARKSKANLYHIIDRIVYMYHEEKKDIKTIANILQAEGYDISKSSIHRTLKSYADAAKEFQEVYEETKVLVEALKEKPASDVMEGITKILANRLFRFVKDIEMMDFEKPEELILSVDRLAKVIEKLERYRAEKVKQILETAQKDTVSKEDLLQMLKEIYGA